MVVQGRLSEFSGYSEGFMDISGVCQKILESFQVRGLRKFQGTIPKNRIEKCEKWSVHNFKDSLYFFYFLTLPCPSHDLAIV